MCMKTCTSCNQTKPLDEFFKASRRSDGFQSQCKPCANESYRKSRAKKPLHYNNLQYARRAKNVALIREWKVAQGCKFCPELEAVCLEVHHLDPSQKEGDPSDYAGKSFVAFLKEAAKCVVLCANCHRKVHAGLLICE